VVAGDTLVGAASARRPLDLARVQYWRDARCPLNAKMYDRVSETGELEVVSQLENCYLIGFHEFVDTADLYPPPIQAKRFFKVQESFIVINYLLIYGGESCSVI